METKRKNYNGLFIFLSLLLIVGASWFVSKIPVKKPLRIWKCKELLIL